MWKHIASLSKYDSKLLNTAFKTKQALYSKQGQIKCLKAVQLKENQEAGV